MSETSYPPDKVVAFLVAVDRSDLDAMRRFASEEPNLFRKIRAGNDWVVCDAAKRRSTPEAVRSLIELGADVNERDSNGSTGLCWAVTYGRYDVAKVLLECGADPNLDCPLFRLTSNDVQDRVAMAKLLLDHGADINQPFIVEGMPARNALSGAIDAGLQDLVEFLKSRGARLPDAPSPQKAKAPRGEPGDYSADITAHFRKYFGKPDKRAIQEIVPTSDYPVLVRYVPKEKQDSAVLFTEGLSRFEMPVPKGSEQFRRAELMVRLPETWPPPAEAIKKQQWAWPIQRLRKIAAYPVNNNTWLGAMLTVLTDEEPPQPLAPGVDFTSWLLVSLPMKDTVVRCKDGTTIQIYQLFPIYTEEYRYALKHGADALMRLLMKQGIQTHIEVGRANVGLPSRRRSGE
jgi:Suppressor of fused protein (SUFU)/Ankyrin repeats (3 copies)